MMQASVALCRSSTIGRRVLQSHRSRVVQGLTCRLGSPFRSFQALATQHYGFAAADTSPRQILPFVSSCHFLSTDAAEAVVEEDLPRFDEKENLHPSSKAAVDRMGLTVMTEIQAKTFDAASSGRDVLARARTGTGKTLAFLLPALERVLQNPVRNQVNCLILSPTRELAAQIADQARQLTAAHGRDITYQVMFGGSSRWTDIQRLEKKIPTILVATPGRLQDHLDNTHVRGQDFASCFQQTQVLVLDEMDRLLDMGFRQDVENIISYLPNKDRQTLLFSATLPPEVKSTIRQHMRPDFETVDCIHDADPTSHTNDAVEQSHVVLPTDTRLVSGTVEILLSILRGDPNAKLIVFFPTTKMVKFYSELFNHGLGRRVMELHSGKSQSYRTSAANRFREMKRGVLFTSDVSARGVDYPNVTHVVQVGVADSRETYIHRLGRTARAGKKGQGLLILSDVEESFLRALNGLDIPVNPEYQQLVDNEPSDQVSRELDPVLRSIGEGTNQHLQSSAKAAFRGMLGFYNAQLKRLNQPPAQLIRLVNAFSAQVGLKEVPSLDPRTVQKMGISLHTPGLVIGREPRHSHHGGHGGRGHGGHYSRGHGGHYGGNRGGGGYSRGRDFGNRDGNHSRGGHGGHRSRKPSSYDQRGWWE